MDKKRLMMSAALLGLGSPAFAQQASDNLADGALNTSASEADSGDALQEIVVTAQRRAENLQRVPIVVTVSSGSQLAAQGITSSLQLNTIAPGLNIRSTVGAFQPSIRGIGTASNVVENPVSLYIDNVYLPQQREGARELVDIEQIAVLKGPQGTLFGRNATGGVIQITTKAPTQTLQVSAKLELDNYLLGKASAYVNGGLTDTIAASLSGYVATQGRGWGENLTTGNDTQKLDHDYSIRSKVLIGADTPTSLLLILDYSDRRNTHLASQPYRGLPLVVPGIGPLKSEYDTYSGFDNWSEFKGGGVSATFTHDLDFAEIVSISSYRKNEASYLFDNTGAPGTFFTVGSPKSESETFTQELQLVSPKSDVLTWVAGAFYYYNLNGSTPLVRRFSGPLTPLPTSLVTSSTTAIEKAESVAPFAQFTWHFMPETSVTIGGRYSIETRTLKDAVIRATLVNGATPTTIFPQRDITIREPTFRVSLDHRITPDIMGYVSFNTGIKSGGFNILFPPNAPYLPEKLKAYETGLKMELLDRRLRLNVGGFYYDYTNLQVAQFVGGVQSVTNGPGAKLYGVDVDFDFQAGEGLRFYGGFEVLHSEFTNYNNAVFSMPRPGGGVITFAGDATGNRLPLAQKFTGTLSADYKFDVGGGSMLLNGTANYNGDYFFEADNFLRQKAYVILNASATWTPADSNFTFKLWGKNLADERIISQALTLPVGYTAVYGSAPLTVGGTISFSL